MVTLSAEIIEKVLDYIRESVTRGIDRMKTNQGLIPVILCGGGSILIDNNQLYPGVTQVVYY
jgi:hypothetical protein